MFQSWKCGKQVFIKLASNCMYFHWKLVFKSLFLIHKRLHIPLILAMFTQRLAVFSSPARTAQCYPVSLGPDIKNSLRADSSCCTGLSLNNNSLLLVPVSPPTLLGMTSLIYLICLTLFLKICALTHWLAFTQMAKLSWTNKRLMSEQWWQNCVQEESNYLFLGCFVAGRPGRKQEVGVVVMGMDKRIGADWRGNGCGRLCLPLAKYLLTTNRLIC